MEREGEGRRKDGKPYKTGNTRQDGSYAVGKNRAPAENRFAVGDGRKRGRRAEGTKNFETDWEEELNKKIRIKVDGVPTSMTAHRAQVKLTMDAGRKGNIKAQQIIYDKASRVLASKSERPTFSDDGIIEAWLAQHRAGDETGIVGDDGSSANPMSSVGNEGAAGTPEESAADDQ
jgi:hypothetical protein